MSDCTSTPTLEPIPPAASLSSSLDIPRNTPPSLSLSLSGSSYLGSTSASSSSVLPSPTYTSSVTSQSRSSDTPRTPFDPNAGDVSDSNVSTSVSTSSGSRLPIPFMFSSTESSRSRETSPPSSAWETDGAKAGEESVTDDDATESLSKGHVYNAAAVSPGQREATGARSSKYASGLGGHGWAAKLPFGKLGGGGVGGVLRLTKSGEGLNARNKAHALGLGMTSTTTLGKSAGATMAREKGSSSGGGGGGIRDKDRDLAFAVDGSFVETTSAAAAKALAKAYNDARRQQIGEGGEGEREVDEEGVERSEYVVTTRTGENGKPIYRIRPRSRPSSPTPSSSSADNGPSSPSPAPFLSLSHKSSRLHRRRHSTSPSLTPTAGPSSPRTFHHTLHPPPHIHRHRATAATAASPPQLLFTQAGPSNSASSPASTRLHLPNSPTLSSKPSGSLAAASSGYSPPQRTSEFGSIGRFRTLKLSRSNPSLGSSMGFTPSMHSATPTATSQTTVTSGTCSSEGVQTISRDARGFWSTATIRRTDPNSLGVPVPNSVLGMAGSLASIASDGESLLEGREEDEEGEAGDRTVMIEKGKSRGRPRSESTPSSFEGRTRERGRDRDREGVSRTPHGSGSSAGGIGGPYAQKLGIDGLPDGDVLGRLLGWSSTPPTRQTSQPIPALAKKTSTMRLPYPAPAVGAGTGLGFTLPTADALKGSDVAGARMRRSATVSNPLRPLAPLQIQLPSKGLKTGALPSPRRTVQVNKDGRATEGTATAPTSPGLMRRKSRGGLEALFGPGGGVGGADVTEKLDERPAKANKDAAVVEEARETIDRDLPGDLVNELKRSVREVVPSSPRSAAVNTVSANARSASTSDDGATPPATEKRSASPFGMGVRLARKKTFSQLGLAARRSDSAGRPAADGHEQEVVADDGEDGDRTATATALEFGNRTMRGVASAESIRTAKAGDLGRSEGAIASPLLEGDSLEEEDLVQMMEEERERDEKRSRKEGRFTNPAIFDVFNTLEKATVAGESEQASGQTSPTPSFNGGKEGRSSRTSTSESSRSSVSQTSHATAHHITVSTAPGDDRRFVIWGVKHVAQSRATAAAVDPAASPAAITTTSPPLSSKRWSMNGRRATMDGSTALSNARDSSGSSNTASSNAASITMVKEKVMLAATAERWIAELTSRIHGDLLNEFFLTYRIFMHPTDLFRLLVLRFRWATESSSSAEDEAGRRIVRVRTFTVFRHWLLNYFAEDFVPDRELRTMLTDWLNAAGRDKAIREKAKDHRMIIKNLKKVVRQLKETYSTVGPQEAAKAAKLLAQRGQTLVTGLGVGATSTLPWSQDGIVGTVRAGMTASQSEGAGLASLASSSASSGTLKRTRASLSHIELSPSSTSTRQLYASPREVDSSEDSDTIHIQAPSSIGHGADNLDVPKSDNYTGAARPASAGGTSDEDVDLELDNVVVSHANSTPKTSQGSLRAGSLVGAHLEPGAGVGLADSLLSQMTAGASAEGEGEAETLRDDLGLIDTEKPTGAFLSPPLSLPRVKRGASDVPQGVKSSTYLSPAAARGKAMSASAVGASPSGQVVPSASPVSPTHRLSMVGAGPLSPFALPMPHNQNVISRYFTSTMGTIGRFKRMLGNRSMHTPTGLGSCASVGPFAEIEFDHSEGGDLLYIRGGLEQYLRFFEMQQQADKDAFLADESSADYNASTSETPSSDSIDTPWESDARETTPEIVAGEVDDAPLGDLLGAGAGAVTPTLDEHALHHSLSTQTIKSQVSPSKPAAIVRSSIAKKSRWTVSSAVSSLYNHSRPKSRLEDHPVFSIQPREPSMIQLDDLDLSDDSDNDESDVKRTLRRLPAARDLRHAGHFGPLLHHRASIDTLSSLGTTRMPSYAMPVPTHQSSASDDWADAPAGVPVVANFTLDGMESDEEEPGDVEAALRRLEGQIDEKRQKEKAKVVEAQMHKSQQLSRDPRGYALRSGTEDDSDASDHEAPSTGSSIRDKDLDRTSQSISSGSRSSIAPSAQGSRSSALVPRASLRPGIAPEAIPEHDGAKPASEGKVSKAFSRASIARASGAIANLQTPRRSARSDPSTVSLIEDHSPSPGEAKPAGAADRGAARRSTIGRKASGRRLFGTMPRAQSQRLSQMQVPIRALPAHRSFLLFCRTEVLAQQFALIERDLLRAISWQELIEGAWRDRTTHSETRDWEVFLKDRAKHIVQAKAHGDRLLPREVQAVIARFNLTCNWVASEIVLTFNLDERVILVGKFIRVAWKCYRQSNFQTLTQIIHGLQMPAIERLHKTWSRIGMWEMRVFKDLKTFTSHLRNFKWLRANMNALCDEWGPPGQVAPGAKLPKTSATGRSKLTGAGCIPFLGIFLRDLSMNAELPTFLDPSSPTSPASVDPNTGELTYLADSPALDHLPALPPSIHLSPLINVHKHRVLASIVQKVLVFQEMASVIPYEADGATFLKCLKIRCLDSDSLRESSRYCEP